MASFRTSWRVVAGLVVVTGCALPQAYTISARPGALNYVEGAVQVNGKKVSSTATLRTFLAANDTLTTGPGSRAEVLLTPGVFVRVAAESQIKMVSSRLIDTQVELQRGEAAVEVGELEKDNNIRVTDGAAVARLEKSGLYRFTTSDPGAIQVLEGEAQVEENGRQIAVKKNKEFLLTDGDLKAQKFDAKSAEDDLYAWSKVRDEYESASSLSAARSVNVSNGFYNSFNGYYTPGWFWNSGWNSWAWLPGDGAFFSPFGFGYFSPLYAGYAPVVYAPVVAGGIPVAVPVNPNRPVQIAGITSKPIPVSGGTHAMVQGWPVNSSGGHISSATFSAHASGNSGAFQGGSAPGGYSGAASSSSASAHSVGVSSAHASAGGGGHH